ncbi:MAG: oligosaccharide flippase family protein [Porphyromonas sp.]|nr:oligosaccharide flippase family protein [Porphyromonas sp.]
MSVLKSLVKDTAIYGISSMFGRFLNWLLVAVYARVLLPAEMGQMTQLYALTAVLMVFLTYGMETAFFRYVNKSEQPQRVYGTTLMMLGASSLVFALGGIASLDWLTSLFDFDTGGTSRTTAELLVGAIILITALDAFCAIPLGYLRYAQRPFRFMAVRMGFVLFTVVATLLAFYVLPQWVSLDMRVYALPIILGINLVGCLLQLVMLLPTFRFAEWHFDAGMARAMLGYGWPILLMGIVGIFSGQADKLIFPLLYDDPLVGKVQLGIYSACYKIAVVMMLFTQAFRYAYDPFVFAKAKEGGESAKRAYAEAMRYYVLFTLFIFLGVMSILDLLKHFVTPEYYAGLPVVPLVMLGMLMNGVYFNLSVWYKVTDRTKWGAYFSIFGATVSLLWIVLATPYMGFMACAWAAVGSNALIMLASYFVGQRYYPVRYPLGAIAGYTALALSLWGIQELFADYVSSNEWLCLGFNLALLFIFVAVVFVKEGLYRMLPNLLGALRRKGGVRG